MIYEIILLWKVRDLLVRNKKSKLEIRERPDCGVYVRDLSSVMVHSPNEMEKLMSLGSRNRTFQLQSSYSFSLN